MQKEVKTSIWCSLCKKSGHSSQDCLERLVCQFCGKPGHEARDCYFLKGMQANWASPSVSVHQSLLPTPRIQVESMYTTPHVNSSNERKPPFRSPALPIMCYRCGEYGHFQGKCSLPEGSPHCRFCPDTMDHYSKDCPKKKASTSGSAPSYQVNVISVDKGKQPAIHSSKREESSTLKYQGTQFSPVHSQWHLSEKEDPNGCDAPGKYGRFVSPKEVVPFFKKGQVEQSDLKEEQVTKKFDQFCKNDHVHKVDQSLENGQLEVAQTFKNSLLKKGQIFEVDLFSQDDSIQENRLFDSFAHIHATPLSDLGQLHGDVSLHNHGPEKETPSYALEPDSQQRKEGSQELNASPSFSSSPEARVVALQEMDQEQGVQTRAQKKKEEARVLQEKYSGTKNSEVLQEIDKVFEETMRELHSGNEPPLPSPIPSIIKTEEILKNTFQQVSLYDLLRMDERFRSDVIGIIEAFSPPTMLAISRGHTPTNLMKASIFENFTKVSTNSLTDFRSSCLSVTIYGITINGVIIDGGSGINLIPDFTLKSLGLQLSGEAKFTITLADQSRVKPLGIVEKVLVEMDGLTFFLDFMVLNLLQVNGGFPLLIGRPWLRHIQAMHDWGNDTILVNLQGKVQKQVHLDLKGSHGGNAHSFTILEEQHIPIAEACNEIEINDDQDLLEWMEAFPCYGISICEGDSEHVETLGLGEPVMDLRRGKKGVLKDLTQEKEKRAAIDNLPIPFDIPWMKELSPSWMQEKESKINIEESPAYPQCIFEDQNEESAMTSQRVRQVNLGTEEHSQPILLATWLWDH
ncbi:hypothetical protein KP509_15G060600 [Ceratopteris richardii]|uniref:CCHC-type domain-containing protein n=1 Tax=Ceratopteris richardii TaxID=49495 RepID=A0A8T2T3Z1_CERRI|nr:hypothetical protein KP509_15G060600 [Ceratopteris richardii]